MMNRRRFVAALSALFVVPFLPKPKPVALCRCGKPMGEHKPLTQDEFEERYLRPAVQAMVDEQDRRAMEMVYGSMK